MQPSQPTTDCYLNHSKTTTNPLWLEALGNPKHQLPFPASCSNGQRRRKRCIFPGTIYISLFHTRSFTHSFCMCVVEFIPGSELCQVYHFKTIVTSFLIFCLSSACFRLFWFGSFSFGFYLQFPCLFLHCIPTFTCVAFPKMSTQK